MSIYDRWQADEDMDAFKIQTTHIIKFEIDATPDLLDKLLDALVEVGARQVSTTEVIDE